MGVPAYHSYLQCQVGLCCCCCPCFISLLLTCILFTKFCCCFIRLRALHDRPSYFLSLIGISSLPPHTSLPGQVCTHWTGYVICCCILVLVVPRSIPAHVCLVFLLQHKYSWLGSKGGIIFRLFGFFFLKKI